MRQLWQWLFYATTNRRILAHASHMPTQQGLLAAETVGHLAVVQTPPVNQQRRRRLLPIAGYPHHQPSQQLLSHSTAVLGLELQNDTHRRHGLQASPCCVPTSSSSAPCHTMDLMQSGSFCASLTLAAATELTMPSTTPLLLKAVTS